MTTKYRLVVADISNPTYSKMSATVAQHLAVSFGYPLRNFKPGAGEVLVFDPNTKDVAVSNRAFIKNKAVTAFTADYLVGALENPELDVTTVDAGDGIHDASVWEDSITFRSRSSKLIGTVTVPKSFIRKAMGWTADNLPTARFYYNGVSRLVQIVKMDDDYIKGFEIEKDDNLVIRTFKVYSMDRVEGNIGISFQQS